MTEPRKCPNCAAIVKTNDMRFCGFCGTGVPAVDRPKPVGPWGDLDARFEELEERAESAIRHRRRRPPSDAGVVAGYGFKAVFGLVFAGVAIFLLMESPGTGLFVLIPVVLAIVGIGMAVRSGASAARVRSAPLRRVPALVADERTEVSGGGEDSSATTTYFVTLQFRTGRRHEYSVADRLAGAVTRGDMGIAYTKAGHLLDFDRVDV